MTRAATSTARRRILRLIVSGSILIVGVALAAAVHDRVVLSEEEAQQLGRSLHETAWNATFIERGLPLPVPARPREGWWGVDLPSRPDPELVWRIQEKRAEGRFDIGEDGLQVEGEGPTLLVTGGSVAAGSCASTKETTWFARLARRTGRRVVVAATGGWVSSQEVSALRRFLPRVRPDVVLMLTGLNDLTVSFIEEGEGGTQEERRARFLANVERAAALARDAGATLVIALQPLIADKRLTPVEQTLLRSDSEQSKNLRASYEELRSGLRALEARGLLRFFDVSRVFEGQPTTFVDLWHFSDPGQAILADRLAEALQGS